MSVPEGLGQQEIRGTKNQAIGAMYGGNAIGNVEGNVTIEAAKRMTSPFQLPLNVDDFTGREAELAEIYAALAKVGESGTVVISAVAGMAGVGKSALAICAAHQRVEQFPDAQLYVNLQGADAQPKDPSAVLADWLRVFGMDGAEIPLELDARVTCYRSWLANKRSLVLLDNAHDEAQVRPLLPGGAGCAVMVTSRKSLALAGAREIPLKTLLPADAVALLAKLAGTARVEAERQAAEEIVRLCGYLPIAIRIAGGVLRRPAKRLEKLADYAAELRDERGRLDRLKMAGGEDVRASFNLSYRQLSEAEQRLFGLLGVLAADFGGLLAAAVGEVTTEEAEETVDRLIDAQLMDVIQSGRYRYHDLMRLYAQEQLGPDDRLAAQERAFQWYWDGADYYEKAFDSQRRRQVAAQLDSEATAEVREMTFYQTALAWFEVERTHLLTAFEWGYEQKRHNEIVSFAGNLMPFFQARGYWQNWEDTHVLALAAAKKSENRKGESQTLNNLGVVYRLQGRWDDAIAQYEQSLEIMRSLGHRHGEGKSLNNLGLVYELQGRWDDAIAQYEQSLEIMRSLGDHHGEGKSLNNLGLVYKLQGRWDDAIAQYEQDLEICRSLGDHHGEGATLNNLGLVYESLGRWDDAITQYEQSLEIMRSLGDRHREGTTLMNVGNAYQLQGRWEDAIMQYEQSLEIRRSLDDRHGEGQTLSNLGYLFATQNQYPKAIDYWQTAQTKLHPDSPEAKQIAQELKQPYGSIQQRLTRRLPYVLLLILLLFAAFNLLRGHWLIATLTLLTFAAFLTYRLWKRRRGHR